MSDNDRFALDSVGDFAVAAAGFRAAGAVEKDACKPGETSASTGCTPASGSPAGRPTGGPGKPKPVPAGAAQVHALSAFEAAARPFADLKAAGERFGAERLAELPKPAQGAIAKVWGAARYVEHKLMLGFAKSRELAVTAAQERGMPEEQAQRLGKILGTVDLVSAWTVNMPATFAATGSMTAAKLASWVPVASLAYVAYSTARNPLATARAAKKVIRGGARHKGFSSARKSAVSPEQAGALADRLHGAGEQADWYAALLSAALDEGQAFEEALRRADAAFARAPANPAADSPLSADDGGLLPAPEQAQEKAQAKGLPAVRKTTDDNGAEHDAGTGQFASGSGGSSAGRDETPGPDDGEEEEEEPDEEAEARAEYAALKEKIGADAAVLAAARSQLDALGVSLKLDGDKLSLHPKANLTPEALAFVKDHKPALVDALKEEAAPSTHSAALARYEQDHAAWEEEGARGRAEYEQARAGFEARAAARERARDLLDADITNEVFANLPPQPNGADVFGDPEYPAKLRGALAAQKAQLDAAFGEGGAAYAGLREAGVPEEGVARVSAAYDKARAKAQAAAEKFAARKEQVAALSAEHDALTDGLGDEPEEPDEPGDEPERDEFSDYTEGGEPRRADYGDGPGGDSEYEEHRAAWEQANREFEQAHKAWKEESDAYPQALKDYEKELAEFERLAEKAEKLEERLNALNDAADELEEKYDAACNAVMEAVDAAKEKAASRRADQLDREEADDDEPEEWDEWEWEQREPEEPDPDDYPREFGDAPRAKASPAPVRKEMPAADAAAQPQELLAVPDIRQPDSFSCGAAAAMACGRFFGVGPTTVEEWKAALGTDPQDGTPPEAIVNYLRSLELGVEAKENMTPTGLADCWAQGRPVIVCCQDYAPGRKARNEWEFGHYLTFVGGPALGRVFFQDSLYDDVVEPDGVDTTPGQVMIPVKDWLDLWHDQGADGRKYVRFGIAVGPPKADNGGPPAPAE